MLRTSIRRLARRSTLVDELGAKRRDPYATDGFKPLDDNYVWAYTRNILDGTVYTKHSDGGAARGTSSSTLGLTPTQGREGGFGLGSNPKTFTVIDSVPSSQASSRAPPPPPPSARPPPPPPRATR
ncbi:hypothetical protein FOZ62_000168 [Perkinsus olseni]|uniref:Uncharacterized protein n=1 Tax=Perkinsus olseni TaxID=32597 RepID=A0A7J6Q844_PEROL|nr:hypothetical protein FOZ62_000168 [Perkinsus olseni]